MPIPQFHQKCYDLLVKVPRGKVTTYRELARALNSKAYRAVGTAMNKNPFAPKIPCHRVINANGRLGQYAHGQAKKREMLKKEGIEIRDDRISLKEYLFTF